MGTSDIMRRLTPTVSFCLRAALEGKRSMDEGVLKRLLEEEASRAWPIPELRGEYIFVWRTTSRTREWYKSEDLVITGHPVGWNIDISQLDTFEEVMSAAAQAIADRHCDYDAFEVTVGLTISYNRVRNELFLPRRVRV